MVKLMAGMAQLHMIIHGRGSDVQLEFVMLDPYVRTTLKHNGKVCSRKQPYFGLGHKCCACIVRDFQYSAWCRFMLSDMCDRDL